MAKTSAKPPRPAKKPKVPSRPKPARAARSLPARRRPAAVGPWATVTPHLVVDGAADAIAWYVKAFGARELARSALPNGLLMHAAIQIGDAQVMLSDSFGPAPTAMVGVTLHIHDEAIDAMWQRAVQGGATVVLPLANQFWGDRYGQLRDPFGHLWSLGWPARMTQAEKDRLRDEAARLFASGRRPGA